MIVQDNLRAAREGFSFSIWPCASMPPPTIEVLGQCELCHPRKGDRLILASINEAALTAAREREAGSESGEENVPPS